MWIVGITLGIGAAVAWVATAIQEPNVRTLVRLLLVASVAWALSRVDQEDASSTWVRHAINLGGMFASQSVFFAWARVPGWTPSAAEPVSPSSVSLQFRIADLLAVTTAFGCLLGLAIRYRVPVASSTYWTVLILIWFAAPIIAGNFALASLARSLGRGASHIGIGILLVAGTAIGVTFAEPGITFVEQGTSSLTAPARAMALSYGLIFFAYGATFLMVGLAGRFQVIDRQRDSEPNTDAAATT